MQIEDMATGGMLDVRVSDITPAGLVETLGRVAAGAPAIVPCGTCTSCCWYARNDVIPAEERPEDLAYLDMAEDERGWHLRKRDDGACIHLGASGCTIHPHRPKVCRAYDCRVPGLAGMALQASPGHCAPIWQFPLKTPLDRAIILAAGQAAAPYMEACRKGEPDPTGNIMVEILKGICENLPRVRAAVAMFDGLSPDEQREFVETHER